MEDATIAAVTAMFLLGLETLGKATAKLIDKIFLTKTKRLFTKEDLEKVRRAAEIREAQKKPRRPRNRMKEGLTMALRCATITLQLVFARMFHSGDNASVLEDQPDMQNIGEDQHFIDTALQGIEQNAPLYDDIIQSFSPKRALDRIPVLDRAILRLSFHELAQNQAPPGVIINEAVELAKRYGESQTVALSTAY